MTREAKLSRFLACDSPEDDAGQNAVPARTAFAVKIPDGLAGRKKTQEGLLGLIQNAGLRVNGNAALC